MEQVPSPERPKMRERVEGHPLGLIAGVVLAAVTATISVVVPVLQITQDNLAQSTGVNIPNTTPAETAMAAGQRNVRPRPRSDAPISSRCWRDGCAGSDSCARYRSVNAKDVTPDVVLVDLADKAAGTVRTGTAGFRIGHNCL